MSSEASSTSESSTSSAAPWHVLEAIDRRVLGVLIEKAKTTPENYPLSLNGLKSGCNQKSNRFPQMQLDEDQIAESIDRLRGFKALSVIQGDGRVEKYRHLAYEWMGVTKVELAVMAELLLRGAQTIGELRGRAARMEPIKGMDELGPLLASLLEKGLILYLTPPGRGAVVTHNLYLPRELEKVQRESGVTTPPGEQPPAPPTTPHSAPPLASPPARVTPEEKAPPQNLEGDEQLHALREELAHLRSSMAAFREETESALASLRNDIDDLNRQLGN